MNKPRLSDDYYESFISDGDLESKYATSGSHDVTYLEYTSDNDSIQNIRIWYPTELKSNQEL